MSDSEQRNKEVVTINVGEAGINFGDTVWSQYNIEHNIDHQGNIQSKPDNNIFKNFYNETETGRYIPRTLMIDTDPSIINQLTTSHHASLYDLQHLISSNLDEDAANNFARGHYTVGKSIIDSINDSLRSIAEECDNLDGFVVNHAIGGGTGSGLTCLILERICVDYRKKSKYTLSIHPFYENRSDSNSSIAVEAYNALLTTHWLLDHSELCIVLDNKRIYDLCKTKLNIRHPNYNDMNLLMAKIESSLTSHFRIKYEGYSRYYNGFWGYYETLSHGWMSRRIKFITPSLAPLHDDQCIFIPKAGRKGNKGKILIDGFVRKHRNYAQKRTAIAKNATPLYKDIYGNNRYVREYIPNYPKHNLLYVLPLYQDLMNIIYKQFMNEISFYDVFMDVINEESFMVAIPDYDNDFEDRFVQIAFNVHGCIDDKLIWRDTICPARYKVIKSEAWTGGNFHYSMDDKSLKTLPNDTMKQAETSVVMFANNLGIIKYFENTMSKTYDKMYSQRAFVHWYVGEGMEEGEFAEAREDLGFLQKDYYDVTHEEPTDEEDLTE